METLAHEVSALNASVKQQEDRHADVLAEVKNQLGVQMAQMQAQLQNNGMDELKQMLSDSQTARTQEAAAAGESAELEKLEEELSKLRAELSNNSDCGVKLQATQEKLVAADAMLSLARQENAQTREEAKQSEVRARMAVCACAGLGSGKTIVCVFRAALHPSVCNLDAESCCCCKWS